MASRAPPVLDTLVVMKSTRLKVLTELLEARDAGEWDSVGSGVKSLAVLFSGSGAEQGHRLAGAQGSLFWGECFVYNPEQGVRLVGCRAAVSVAGWRVCAEWVFTCAL